MSTNGKIPFWDRWRCRRNANLFLVSLGAPFGFLILTGILRLAGLDQYIPYVLAGFGLLLAALVSRAIRQAQARRRERLPRSPLSRDEWRVARSKLQQYRKAKNL